jgi:hypothetical protein
MFKRDETEIKGKSSPGYQQSSHMEVKDRDQVQAFRVATGYCAPLHSRGQMGWLCSPIYPIIGSFHVFFP